MSHIKAADDEAFLSPETVERIRKNVKEYLERMEPEPEPELEKVKVSPSQVKICQCRKCWGISQLIVYHNLERDVCPVCGASSRYQVPVTLAPDDPVRQYTRNLYHLPSNHPAVIEMNKQIAMRGFNTEVKSIPYSYLAEMINILKYEIENRPSDEHKEPEIADVFSDMTVEKPEILSLKPEDKEIY